MVESIVTACKNVNVYHLLNADAGNGKTNWVSLLRDKLVAHGFAYVWFNQGIGNKFIFLSEVKQGINDNVYQSLHSEIEHYSRDKRYLIFNENLISPSYLNLINVEKYRKALCKFSLSYHS